MNTDSDNFLLDLSKSTRLFGDRNPVTDMYTANERLRHLAKQRAGLIACLAKKYRPCAENQLARVVDEMDYLESVREQLPFFEEAYEHPMPVSGRYAWLRVAKWVLQDLRTSDGQVPSTFVAEADSLINRINTAPRSDTHPVVRKVAEATSAFFQELRDMGYPAHNRPETTVFHYLDKIAA